MALMCFMFIYSHPWVLCVCVHVYWHAKRVVVTERSKSSPRSWMKSLYYLCIREYDDTPCIGLIIFLNGGLNPSPKVISQLKLTLAASSYPNGSFSRY